MTSRDWHLTWRWRHVRWLTAKATLTTLENTNINKHSMVNTTHSAHKFPQQRSTLYSNTMIGTLATIPSLLYQTSQPTNQRPVYQLHIINYYEMVMKYRSHSLKSRNCNSWSTQRIEIYHNKSMTDALFQHIWSKHFNYKSANAKY